MNGPGRPPKGKGRIRSLSRKGTRRDQSPLVALKLGNPREPTICDRCGAVFVHRTWRKARRLTQALLARSAWGVCPACEQVGREEGFGRIVIRGAYPAVYETEIRRRVRNVDARAQFTQPERRVASVARSGPVLEVLTTSQKLAHRIVHELKKAFRGRASYAWSDRDGSLYATWERDDLPAAKPAARTSPRRPSGRSPARG